MVTFRPSLSNNIFIVIIILSFFPSIKSTPIYIIHHRDNKTISMEPNRDRHNLTSWYIPLSLFRWTELAEHNIDRFLYDLMPPLFVSELHNSMYVYINMYEQRHRADKKKKSSAIFAALKSTATNRANSCHSNNKHSSGSTSISNNKKKDTAIIIIAKHVKISINQEYASSKRTC